MCASTGSRLPPVELRSCGWYQVQRVEGRGLHIATIPVSAEADRGEAKFFFTMACVMSASIVAGFSFNLAMGRSSFSLPWLVHFHAWVMMGWVALYLTQNAMVFSDNLALHRRLGWLSVI